MNLEMVFKIAKEMNWPIADTLAKLEMNDIKLSDDARKLGEVMGVFDSGADFDF